MPQRSFLIGLIQLSLFINSILIINNLPQGNFQRFCIVLMTNHQNFNLPKLLDLIIPVILGDLLNLGHINQIINDKTFFINASQKLQLRVILKLSMISFPNFIILLASLTLFILFLRLFFDLKHWRQRHIDFT